MYNLINPNQLRFLILKNHIGEIKSTYYIICLLYIGMRFLNIVSEAITYKS